MLQSFIFVVGGLKTRGIGYDVAKSYICSWWVKDQGNLIFVVGG